MVGLTWSGRIQYNDSAKSVNMLRRIAVGKCVDQAGVLCREVDVQADERIRQGHNGGKKMR